MDDRTRIANWLRRRNRIAACFFALGAAGSLLVGLIALVVTWWGIYLALWVGLGWFMELTHFSRSVTATVLVVLLFPANAWTDRRQLESFTFTSGTASRQVVGFVIPMVGYGSTINPLTPDSLGSFAKAIALLLFLAPRFLTAAVQWCLLARRLLSMDVPGVADLLAYLAGNAKRVSFKSIIRAREPGTDLQSILPQLREVDGVLFLLQSDPPGLSLSLELREELHHVLMVGQEDSRAPA